MNRVWEILGKINEAIKSLLAKIEESSIFERILIFYEGLDPSKQALARGILRFGCFALAIVTLFSPLMKSYSSKSDIKTFDEAAFQLQLIAAKGSEVVSQAPKPSTWQSLPASSSAELENSMREYLANIGVPDELFVAQADGLDRFNLNIEELTLRQALAITFQFDGWHPAVRTENLEIKIHGKNPDRLSLSIAAFIPAASPGSEDFGSHDNDFEGTTHNPEGTSNPNGETSHFGGGDNPDYFDSDPNQVPPPPVEFNDNPPPPPPNFDESFDDNPPVFEENGDI